jgi:hypothetical protein
MLPSESYRVEPEIRECARIEIFRTVRPAGLSESGAIRLDFDHRLMVQFRGSVVMSDAGLLAYRKLDDVLGLSAMARARRSPPARTRNNGRHALAGCSGSQCSAPC